MLHHKIVLINKVEKVESQETFERILEFLYFESYQLKAINTVKT
jgi:hypothetical protein